MLLAIHDLYIQFYSSLLGNDYIHSPDIFRIFKYFNYKNRKENLDIKANRILDGRNNWSKGITLMQSIHLTIKASFPTKMLARDELSQGLFCCPHGSGKRQVPFLSSCTRLNSRPPEYFRFMHTQLVRRLLLIQLLAS